MENDVLRLKVKILRVFKTEVSGTVGSVVVGDLILSKPDQGYLLPPQCSMVTVSSCHHVPQVDQGSSAGEDSHIDTNTTCSSLALLPKKSSEGELPRKSVLPSSDPLLSPRFSAASKLRKA